MVELLDQMVADGRLKMTNPVPMKVTYHDPCHLGRQGEDYVPWDGIEKKIFGQAVVYDPPRPRYNGAFGVYDAPRNVLKAIPGVELVEMERIKEGAWCCGAGGGAREAYPKFSEWTADERIEEAESTGADALVTACPWCERNFIDAVRGTKGKLEVLDILQLVDHGPLSGRIRKMEISRDAYRAIEDIVGPENVTDDPAFLDSYAFEWLAELVRPNRSHYMPRPWAVVMPASTREVQAVTKVCNKYKIKIKPISTGWYHWAAPMKDNEPTVQLDLRRMNRIIDIDEKNRFAIVEPYVICAQLQAEAMKRGLNCNIIGAGSSTSVVASACAYFGGGPSSYYTGNNSDNLLGQEWVTPGGKIVRTGSLSSGRRLVLLGRPGSQRPRGVTRGILGFARRPRHLHQMRDQARRLAGTDRSSKSRVRRRAIGCRFRENFRAYTIGAPNWDAWANCYYAIYDNGIGYIFHRQFNLAGADLATALWLTYIDPTKTLNDVETAAKDPEIIADQREGEDLVPTDPGRAVHRRHPAAGQDPRRKSSPRPAATRWSGIANRTWPNSPTCTCCGSATSTATSSGPAATWEAGCSRAPPISSRATCPPRSRASSTTSRATCWSSAAATR